MLLFPNISRVDKDSFSVLDTQGKEHIITQDFPIEEWNSPEYFLDAGIKGYEPMTAKELDTEEKQDESFLNSDNFIEEKFDGTRGLLYFFKDHCRVFSRRISKKTGFYVENTDSLPQLKTISKPELEGTIIDGELFIDNRPFKDVSGTLNCLWDKAIERQIDLGFITFHAFDIISYRGNLIRNTPLWKRKKFLNIVVDEAESQYISEVKYYSCGSYLGYPDTNKNNEVCTYPLTNFWNVKNHSAFKSNKERNDWFDKEVFNDKYPSLLDSKEKDIMTPRAYYELIVATGGEGVIVKPKNGKYLHKRGWEYSKIKKFLTRELILLGFTEPTKEYSGKAPETWEYWDENIPVTKNWYNNQVGNLRLGVLITHDELSKIPKSKQGELFSAELVFGRDIDSLYIMEICECSGFDDEMREYFTDNKDDLIGSVVEVRANEIMKDSGRLRHPRYERLRFDKNAEQCIWKEHIIY